MTLEPESSKHKVKKSKPLTQKGKRETEVNRQRRLAPTTMMVGDKKHTYYKTYSNMKTASSDYDKLKERGCRVHIVTITSPGVKPVAHLYFKGDSRPFPRPGQTIYQDRWDATVNCVKVGSHRGIPRYRTKTSNIDFYLHKIGPSEFVRVYIEK